MGFVLLGLAAANSLGLGGAVFQMFSHGVIGALLFAIVGRMIYPRTHTRDIYELSRFNLKVTLPFATLAFVIASAASMGIPGFSGFAAEISILIGTWTSYPVGVVVTGIGMVLVAAFTLRALKTAFFSDQPQVQSPAVVLPPITFPEKCGAILLMAVTLCAGVYPQLLFDRINPALHDFRVFHP